jgi:hypothetical protein
MRDSVMLHASGRGRDLLWAFAVCRKWASLPEQATLPMGHATNGRSLTLHFAR